MIFKLKSKFYSRILLVFAIAVAGCGRDTNALPDDGPEIVAKRFYELISAAKLEGGSTTASEAFKMVDTKISQMNVNQFLEVVKRYPEKFAVEVGKTEIKGTQALVAISYKMPSSFGGEYNVQEVLPLNIDTATNTWKIDFTGDTYGMQKDDAIEASKLDAPPHGNPGNTETSPGGK